MEQMQAQQAAAAAAAPAAAAAAPAGAGDDLMTQLNQLAQLHQAGALLLFSVALYLYHRMQYGATAAS